MRLWPYISVLQGDVSALPARKMEKSRWENTWKKEWAELSSSPKPRREDGTFSPSPRAGGTVLPWVAQPGHQPPLKSPCFPLSFPLGCSSCRGAAVVCPRGSCV